MNTNGGTDIKRVLLTGATGFVGRYVLRELLRRGHTAICLVRSKMALSRVCDGLDRSRVIAVEGSLFNRKALAEAAAQSEAAIHLVGIIMERRLVGQTFDRVHRRGTEAVVDALMEAGISRYVHMSALGSREGAVAEYHRSKFAAEQYVRESNLDWTIFRPSVIHGCDGEFMELMRTFVAGLVPPVIPYFGTGESKIQPVSVRDVAHCFVDSLRRDATIGQIYPMGGPKAYSWKQLYLACQRLIPHAKRWKPMVGQPVPVARFLARTVMKTPLVPKKLKFNTDQVTMSQEDSICDITPVEAAFGIKMRDFESELGRYADLIG